MFLCAPAQTMEMVSESDQNYGNGRRSRGDRNFVEEVLHARVSMSNELHEDGAEAGVLGLGNPFRGSRGLTYVVIARRQGAPRFCSIRQTSLIN